LPNKLAVHSNEDLPFPFAQSRIGLGGLSYRHDRLAVQLVAHGIAEMLGKGGWGKPKYPLQLSNPFRLGCGLAGEPLRDRGLGDPKRGGKLPLGQTALAASALERPCEAAPLIGRRHALVLSRAGITVNRMPDQAITGRFPRPDNFLVIGRSLFTYTARATRVSRKRQPRDCGRGEAP
jgi:hypothetical protein